MLMINTMVLSTGFIFLMSSLRGSTHFIIICQLIRILSFGSIYFYGIGSGENSWFIFIFNGSLEHFTSGFDS